VRSTGGEAAVDGPGRSGASYTGSGVLAGVKRYENGAIVNETRYVRDGFLALQERDSSNGVMNEYTWGIDIGGGIGGLINLHQGGQDYSYLFDGRGNVSVLIDGSQAVVAGYVYDAFGNLLAKSGGLEQPYLFSTKEYDERTGLSYYGYRFYSPALGRWTTRDPLEEDGGINLYGFVENNPVNAVDPWGLATTGTRWPGILLPFPIVKLTPDQWRQMQEDLGLGDPLESRSNKGNSKPGSKPKNCPTGIKPIDEHPGLDTRDIHKIKKCVNANPNDWVGITPDGDVVIGEDGEAVTIGPYKDFLPWKK